MSPFKQILLAVMISLSLLSSTGWADDAPVACPMIAKLCPDGSSVSPQGPKCQIPPCPNGGDARLQNPPPEDDCSGDDCEGKRTDEEND